MAFVVEDGTGTTATANAYITVQEFKDHHNSRGNSITGLGTTEIQKLIVQATDYVDSRFGQQIGGLRLVSTQPLEFPRKYLVRKDGTELSGVPANLKKAMAEYALLANTNDLYLTPTADASGQMVVRQKVGPIETEFQEGAAVGQTFREWPAADQWMSEFLVSAGGGTFRS